MDTGISNCRHIPDAEISSSKAVDLQVRPAGSFQQTSTISAHSIRISARGRCMSVLSAGGGGGVWGQGGAGLETRCRRDGRPTSEGGLRGGRGILLVFFVGRRFGQVVVVGDRAAG